MIQRGKEVLIRDPDVPHPLQQIQCRLIGQGVLDECPCGGDMDRSFGDTEAVRRRSFGYPG